MMRAPICQKKENEIDIKLLIKKSESQKTEENGTEKLAWLSVSKLDAPRRT